MTSIDQALVITPTTVITDGVNIDDFPACVKFWFISRRQAGELISAGSWFLHIYSQSIFNTAFAYCGLSWLNKNVCVTISSIEPPVSWHYFWRLFCSFASCVDNDFGLWWGKYILYVCNNGMSSNICCQYPLRLYSCLLLLFIIINMCLLTYFILITVSDQPGFNVMNELFSSYLMEIFY